ncbi:MAG: hypothetical protein H0Z39_06980 [Peptococcaceae bacterium]|nr:hypothetical protein [Peptococcaceae bacterium]
MRHKTAGDRGGRKESGVFGLAEGMSGRTLLKSLALEFGGPAAAVEDFDNLSF